MTRLMMILSLTAAGLTTVGCASSPSDATAETAPMQAEARRYQPATASALAFDPPMALYQPMPAFDREGRELAAFAGYEDQVTMYSYTHQRDEIRVYNDAGRLERRGYTDRTSVIRR